mmetsp:Transcript_8111/g.21202  ORF Transcript_8111/g.21202 Transcript_8111/m.21202 type:complete len:239 (-) Transcript_8111:118-834(-)
MRLSLSRSRGQLLKCRGQHVWHCPWAREISRSKECEIRRKAEESCRHPLDRCRRYTAKGQRPCHDVGYDGCCKPLSKRRREEEAVQLPSILSRCGSSSIPEQRGDPAADDMFVLISRTVRMDGNRDARTFVNHGAADRQARPPSLHQHLSKVCIEHAFCTIEVEAIKNFAFVCSLATIVAQTFGRVAQDGVSDPNLEEKCLCNWITWILIRMAEQCLLPIRLLDFSWGSVTCHTQCIV